MGTEGRQSEETERSSRETEELRDMIPEHEHHQEAEAIFLFYLPSHKVISQLSHDGSKLIS